jgi:hypothetical protein
MFYVELAAHRVRVGGYWDFYIDSGLLVLVGNRYGLPVRDSAVHCPIQDGMIVFQSVLTPFKILGEHGYEMRTYEMRQIAASYTTSSQFGGEPKITPTSWNYGGPHHLIPNQDVLKKRLRGIRPPLQRYDEIMGVREGEKFAISEARTGMSLADQWAVYKYLLPFSRRSRWVEEL